MKNKPIVTGIIAAASPIPMFIFNILWCWLWYFCIGFGLLNYPSIPVWIDIAALLPIFISPLLGLLSLIHGIVKIKTKRAWLGLLLSALGLMENFLLFYGIIYFASGF